MFNTNLQVRHAATKWRQLFPAENSNQQNVLDIRPFKKVRLFFFVFFWLFSFGFIYPTRDRLELHTHSLWFKTRVFYFTMKTVTLDVCVCANEDGQHFYKMIRTKQKLIMVTYENILQQIKCPLRSLVSCNDAWYKKKRIKN